MQWEPSLMPSKPLGKRSTLNGSLLIRPSTTVGEVSSFIGETMTTFQQKEAEAIRILLTSARPSSITLEITIQRQTISSLTLNTMVPLLLSSLFLFPSQSFILTVESLSSTPEDVT